jgi:predicted transposase/invertase (TIGR01784 family)
MRDEYQPNVSLGNILQMNLIELSKADRLGLPSDPLTAWITFFKHWQEELTMANIAHEPVKKAMNRIKQLSADEETRRLAFVRERALRDEVSFINDAELRGIEKGRENVAQKLIEMNVLTDDQIATASGLTIAEVKALRSDDMPVHRSNDLPK